MAFYVRLTKVSETGHAAVYRFSPDQQSFGEARIDKATGTVTVLRPLTGPAAEPLAARAAAKLRTAWRHGGLPETAEWAS
jgi:hypothetical protein